MRTIFFELNEVPWKIIHWFIERHPQSAFATLSKSGSNYETHAADSGELHPWITWPTLHRGVSNDVHGISHLGQDLRESNRDFPALWDMLAREGRTVGVMGAMQSYPLPSLTSQFSFYVPDTYAPTPDTIPASLSLFQDVNLKLTQQNSRNVDRSISKKHALTFMATLPRIGVVPATVKMIGSQLLREVTDKTKLNRRRAVQSALYFDAFMHNLKRSNPEFSSFFSNHVAATMHRFWAASFQEDFDQFDLPDEWVESYRTEIEWAMLIADEFLQRMMNYARSKGDCRIIVLSSMGQAATTAQIRDGYYSIGDIPKFLSGIGIDPEEARPAQAMAPDISLHLSARAAERFRAIQRELEDALGNLQIDIDQRNMLHMRALVEIDIEQGMPTVPIGNRVFTLDDLGFVYVPDQDKVATTAYHIPNGILMAWQPGSQGRGPAPQPVSVLEVAPALLAAHDIRAPDYMTKPSFSF
ncbi:hypothetical protein BH10PSE12_BH10PSE12_29850 [soil metagenome]